MPRYMQNAPTTKTSNKFETLDTTSTFMLGLQQVQILFAANLTV